MKLAEFRLAITGSFGARDIGDEAMLTEDLHYATETIGIPRTNISLFGWDVDYVSRYHKHPIEHCYGSSMLELACESNNIRKPIESLHRIHKHASVRKVRGVIRNSTALLVTGGGTINSRDQQGDSLRRMHRMVRAFAKHQVPVFMSGQTIGPLGIWQKHDAMASQIIDDVDVLTVRDSRYSRRYLNLIENEPRELIETFDDAYSLPYENEVLPEYVRQFMDNRNCVALNVTTYTSTQDTQLKFIAKLCEHLIGTYDTNIVMVSHTPRDLVALWRIFDSIDNSVRNRVLVPDTREWRDAVLKKMISSCRLAIGGRYHFIVFAGTSDTPFIGMAGNHYSYIKQDGFARKLGQERFILTEWDTWDWDVVCERIAERIDQPLSLSQRFDRPSVSMERFGRWLTERFSLESKLPSSLKS